MAYPQNQSTGQKSMLLDSSSERICFRSEERLLFCPLSRNPVRMGNTSPTPPGFQSVCCVRVTSWASTSLIKISLTASSMRRSRRRRKRGGMDSPSARNRKCPKLTNPSYLRGLKVLLPGSKKGPATPLKMYLVPMGPPHLQQVEQRSRGLPKPPSGGTRRQRAL